MPIKTLITPPSLGELAKLVSGEVVGDSKCPISGLCPFDSQQPGCLAFTRELAARRLASALTNSPAAAILVATKAREAISEINRNFLIVPDPFAAIVELIPIFYSEHPLAEGISSKAEVHPSVKLGRSVRIGPFCAIGLNVIIGDDVVIHPQVTIYPGVTIGDRSVIHAGAVIREDCTLGTDSVIQNGAVIGADGFGYIPDGKGGLRAIPQVGIAQLANNVEVGANSCVDRATLGATSIGPHTKLDNLVQVGHNVRIGRSSLLCGHVGVAGSVTIGDGVVLGGHAGVADHLTLVDGVRLAAKTGVTGNILEKGDYAGFPAVPISQWRRMMAALRNLPQKARGLRAQGQNNTGREE